MLEQVFQALGALLEEEHARYRILIIGGSSLLLLGIAIRPTADIDVIGYAMGDSYVKANTLPKDLARAVARVGDTFRLGPKWFNTGPASLFDLGLPPGFEQRITIRTYGGLEVHLPGRYDLICFKLYASVDHSAESQSKHFMDLLALEPTEPELLDAARWTITHDPSPAFRFELQRVLHRLEVVLEDDER